MECSKEIKNIFEKWRLQFSVKFDNPVTDQSLDINQDDHFDCEKCKAKLKNSKGLRLHMTRVHIKPYKCTVCSYSTGVNFELKQHTAIKHDNTVYRCNQCGATFAALKNLKRHVQRHRSEEMKCDECPYKTSISEYLKRHIKETHSKKIINCNECDLTFSSNNLLRNHRRSIHKLAKWIKCQLCDYKQLYESKLRRHTESVHEGKLFHCDLCDYSCKDNGGISKHKKGFHENMYLKCNKCAYVTIRSTHLKTHIESIHSGGDGERYTCEECTRTFKLQRVLSRHIEQTHRNPGSHLCDQCNFKTNYNQTLQKHLQIHKEKIKCEECDYATHWAYMLENHKEVQHLGKGYICGICGARKSRKCYLKQHMLSKHKQETMN